MSKQSEFISVISKLAMNEYSVRGRNAILPSVCIAQAALESGWNLGARTLFGIKGSGFKASTSEYYNGHKVEITDSFRKYPSVASAVAGYYDFISKTPRYRPCNGERDYKRSVHFLQHTTDGLSYATDPNYERKIINIIETYNLTQYDGVSVKFNVGDVYKVMVNGLVVRERPSASARPVGYRRLTANAKNHDSGKNGSLDRGTKVTCMNVSSEGNNIWIKIPSGWIAAVYQGKEYVG